ncbi:energy-coupling factor transporter transmembrane protein EcfT [bacterium]|nr:energy-coupling factor transporter transmembrane protein EcfT [bacterium]
MAVLKLHYISGNSLLHLMHPALKLLILLLIVLSAFLYGAFVNAGLALFVFVLYAANEVGMKRLLSVLKPMPLFVFLIIIANVFLVRNGEPLSAHISRGFLQGLKVVVLVASAGFFLAVTDPIDFSDSIVSVLRPLERIGLKREDISLLLMIIFSFLPHMAEETERLKNARLVRCGHRNWLSRKTGGVVPFLAPLITSLLRRADELELALEARHYGTGRRRVLSGERGMSRVDVLILIIVVLSFLAGLYAKY